MRLFGRKTEERTLALPGWPNDWNLYNQHALADRSGALGIADVYACVRCLSDAAASVPLVTYRRTESGRQRLYSGRLPELLQRPSPGTTQANLVAQAMAHLALWGNAYVAKFRDADGRLEQLGMLHPDRVEVELINGAPRYTVSDAKTGRQSKHGVDDIVHIRGLSIDGLTGLSPIKQARMAVSLAGGLGEFAEAFVRNGARPSGILRLVGGGSSDALEQLRISFESKHAGAQNAHRVAVMTGEVEWVAMAGPLDDLQFCEQRKLSTAEIARVFRVPPWMIGASAGDSMTYSNVEQQALAFVTHSLRPWLVLIEQAISNDPDLCSQNQYCEFLLDALLRADSKTRADIYALALDPVKGWMTRSEVRRLENLEPEGAAAPTPEPQTTNGKALIA
jgi:HK97 family phage portal protein